MQNELKCPICDHAFHTKNPAKPHGARIPLLLHCGHSFCEGCLYKLAQSNKLAITCPFCQVATRLREEGSIKGLWPNVYIMGLLSTDRKIKQDKIHWGAKYLPPGLFQPVQRPAKVKAPKEEGCDECVQRQATCKCVKCEVVLCNPCFKKVHATSKALRNHKSVPLKTDKTTMEIPSECLAHGNRPIEYFCEDDATPICSHCVIIGPHTNHAISPMEEKNKKAFQALEPAISQATNILKRLKKSDRTLVTAVKDIHHEHGQICDKIHTHFMQLHAFLQAREIALKGEVDKMLTETCELEEKRKVVLEAVKDVEAALREGRKIQQLGDQQSSKVQGMLRKLRALEDLAYVAEINEDDDGIKVDLTDDLPHFITCHGHVSGSITARVKLLKPGDFKYDNASPEDQQHCFSIPSSTAEAGSDYLSEGEADSDSTSIASSSTTSASKLGKEKKAVGKASLLHAKQELVYVTHIKNPCQFVVQRCSEFDRLKLLGRQINKHCNKLLPHADVPSYVEAEYLVLAKFSGDGRFYRARVKRIDYEIVPPDIEVVYIDYGNSEVVQLDNMRIIPSKFLKLPEQAYSCSLMDIQPAGESTQWSISAVQAFAKMTEDKPMLLNVFGEKEGVLLADLSKPPVADVIEDDRPMSMRDALIFLEYAVFTTPQPALESKLKKRQFLYPESPKLNSVVSVMMSHVNNPCDFHVQRIGEEARYLHDVMSDLQDLYNKDKRDLYSICCPQCGMICAAQFTEDNHWYRAKITGLPGGRLVTVQYVDFGNSETLPYTRLKKLLDKFLILPAQAVQCSLADVEPVDKENGWSSHASKALGDFASRNLAMRVLDVADDRELKVVLFDSGSQEGIVCINEMLVSKEYAVSSAAGIKNDLSAQDLLKPGEDFEQFGAPVDPVVEVSGEQQKEEVLVKDKPQGQAIIASHVVNPGEFYLQPENSEELTALMDEIQSTYKESEYTIMGWCAGDFCVVRYSSNNKWYRAKITHAQEDRKFTVFLVDYGNTAVIPDIDMRPLIENFMKQNAFSMRCHLTDIQPAGDITRWSHTAQDFFKEKLNGKSCYIVINGEIEDESLPVDLLLETLVPGDALNPDTLEYCSLTQMLKENGLALPKRRTPTRKVKDDAEDGLTMGVQPLPLPDLGFEKSKEAHEEGEVATSASPCTVENAEVITPSTEHISEPKDIPSLVEVEKEVATSANPSRVENEEMTGPSIECISEPEDMPSHVEVASPTPSISEQRETVAERLAASLLSCSRPQSPGVITTQTTVSNKPNTDMSREPAESANTSNALVNEQHIEDSDKPVSQDLTIPANVGQKAEPFTPFPQRTAPSPYQKLELFEPGQHMLVTVTQVDSPSVVYIQYTHYDNAVDPSIVTINNNLDLLIQTSEILNYDSTISSVLDVKAGDTVCAQFSQDGCWYRAEVIAVEGDQAAVIFVDYGSSELVPTSTLRVLPHGLSHLPAQARRCVLAGLEHVNFDDVPGITLYMSQLLACGPVIAEVVDMPKEGDPHIALYDCESYMKHGVETPVIYTALVAKGLSINNNEMKKDLNAEQCDVLSGDV